MKNSDAVIVEIFKQLISSCNKLNLLMKSDLEHFKENKLEQLTTNNTQKNAMMATLSQWVQKLNKECPEGLTKRLEQSSQKEELNILLSELITQIHQCNNIMNENSHIVFLNLQMLKDVWDRLSSLNTQNIYDQKGKIINYSPTL